MKKRKIFVCALFALLIGALPLGLGKESAAAEGFNFGSDQTNISHYVTEGNANVAQGKSVTSTSSYEMPNEGWCNAFLTDGTLASKSKTNGWTTMPGATHNAFDPATVTVDLGYIYKVSRAVLFPRSDQTYGQNFPVSFTVEISTDNTNFNVVGTFSKCPTPTGPLVVDFPEAEARYVKLNVTERFGADDFSGGGSGNDGKLVQLSELAVIGKMEGTVLTLNKHRLELATGMSDEIKADVFGTGSITWSSDNSAVASVDNGKITAKSVGKTIIRASAGNLEEEVEVIVVDRKQGFEDNILISVFWPPTAEYLNGVDDDSRWDEQYKLMQDADIDYINNVTGRDRQKNPDPALIGENSIETNLKMAAFAYKYGMRVSVADTRFGSLQSMSESEVYDLISEYRNVPGVGGYYILDEPYDPLPYAKVYEYIKKADPNGYAHLNFLQSAAYAGKTIEQYKEILGGWLAANESSGFVQDYLMYDYYPYPLSGEMNRDMFFTNLSAVREVGLEYGVKTAQYLQSVCQTVGFRSPSVDEIRYEAMVSLAYGYKQLSYFTWFLPTNRTEPFADSIVGADGQPNPKTYSGVSALNKEIHAIGKTLIKLDSREVYQNGRQWAGEKSIPATFPLQPEDNKRYTAALLKDKTDGRNYIMLVNNDYENAQRVTLSLDPTIKSLQEVSHVDGSLSQTTLVGGSKLVCELSAGDGALFALPEGLDFVDEGYVDYTEGMNLAKGASVKVSSTYTGDGWSPAGVNDGNLSNGWSSAVKSNYDNKPQWISVDLGDKFTVNSVKIYSKAGDAFPVDFSIQVSENGADYTDAASFTEQTSTVGWRTYEIQNAPTARYIRIYGAKLISKGSDGYLMQITELEVYGSPYTDFTAADEFAAKVERMANILASETKPKIDAFMNAMQNRSLLTQSKLNSLLRSAKGELAALTDIDKTAARNALESVEKARKEGKLEGMDTASLDEAVQALTAAVQSDEMTQNRLDDLTDRVLKRLEKLSPATSGNSGSGEQKKGCKGCKSSAGAGAFGAVVALSALAVFKRKR